MFRSALRGIHLCRRVSWPSGLDGAVPIGLCGGMVQRRVKNLIAMAAGLGAVVAEPVANAAANPRQVPYWASLKAPEVYMRVGPGEDYRINWIYHRQHLPLKVLRIMQNWRLVQDPQGAAGWIMVNMLVIGHDGFVTGSDLVEMRDAPDADARLLWRLEPGVLGKISDCSAGWCWFMVGGRSGYVRQANLWGAAQLPSAR